MKLAEDIGDGQVLADSIDVDAKLVPRGGGEASGSLVIHAGDEQRGVGGFRAPCRELFDRGGNL